MIYIPSDLDVQRFATGLKVEKPDTALFLLKWSPGYDIDKIKRNLLASGTKKDTALVEKLGYTSQGNFHIGLTQMIAELTGEKVYDKFTDLFSS